MVNEPVSFGNNQDNNGGLVLKPLDSLAGGGSGLNGFGQNLQPPDFRSNLQTDSGNPSAGISSFSGQNGFAEGRPLKAPETQAEIPESTGGLGEPAARRLGGERRARPPDFRSILQNDVETAPVVNEPVSFGNNQDNNGGLVLKPLDSLAGGGSGLNGFGQNLQPPDFRSNLQTDSGNPSAGISSFSGQNGFAEGRPLKAPETQAEIPESTGGLGEPAARRLSGERRARPPDFRSILQNDVETAPVVNEPVSFGNNLGNNGGLVLKPLDSLAGGGSGLNGFGQNLQPPDFRSNLQTDSGNPSAGISSLSGQSGFANGGLVLKPLDSLAGGGSGLNGFGADAGFGQNLQPPDFRSNLQTDSGNPSAGISSFSGQSDSAVKPLERQAEMPGSLGDFRSDFGEAGAAASAAMLGLDFSVIFAMCPGISPQFRPPNCSNMLEIDRTNWFRGVGFDGQTGECTHTAYTDVAMTSSDFYFSHYADGGICFGSSDLHVSYWPAIFLFCSTENCRASERSLVASFSKIRNPATC